MAFRPSEESASIVLIGAFNPAIFHPSWLEMKELVSISAAKAAHLDVIAAQAAQFSVGGIKLVVLQNRFAAEVDESHNQVRMRDLVAGIFSILGETPLSRLGLNWTFDIQLKDRAVWHDVGDKLVPKEPWEGLLPGRPGMRTVTLQGQRSDEFPGALNVRVEPSSKMPMGVFVEVNNEFVLPASTAASSAVNNTEYFVDLIRSQWEEMRTSSRSVAEQLLQRVGAIP